MPTKKALTVPLRRHSRRIAFAVVLLLAARAHPQEQGSFRVGVFNFFPAVYLDDSGTVAGFYTDMLSEIERRESVRFTYVYGSWDEGLERLKTGEVDLLTSVAYTDERAAYMSYGSVPLLTVWGELCVKKTSVTGPNSGVTTVTDLMGKNVAVMKNDFNAQSFKSYIAKFNVTCEYLEVPDFRAVLAAVRDGEADAGVVSALVGNSLQDEYGLVSSGIAFNPFDIYFTVRKDSHAPLLGMLDRYLTEWKHNPGSVYYSARIKWGRTEAARVPRWVITSLLGLAIVLALAVIFIALLRYRVAAVTRKLVDSSDMLKLILDSTSEGIYGIDSSGNCVFCNAAGAKLLGYGSEEGLLGKNMHETAHRPPGNGDAPTECDCVLDGERSTVSNERYFFRSDGAAIPVEATATPVRDRGGREGAVVTFHDLTERKRAESERVARLSAERANAAKSAFLTNMSHELRTPLNSVIVLSNVLGRRLDGRIPGEEHAYLEVIERNGRNLLGLINEVLDLSRIEAGRERVNPSEFKVSSLVSEIASALAPQAAEKGVEFLAFVPEGIPDPRTDRDKCLHVLMNLAGNAVKFTERGAIRVTARALGDSIGVAVADTGRGVSPDFLPRIFDEFSQADESPEAHRTGTGLGLAIAKRYALLLGGDITVESKVDGGSTFEFTFPVLYQRERKPESGAAHPSRPTGETSIIRFDEARSAMAKTPVSAQREAGSAPRVLLVEDNPDNRIAVRSLLSGTYELLEAENGLEGIKIARKTRPRLILMDLAMPVMDGFAALEILRSYPETENIPVMALSSSAMRGYPEEILAKGFNGYASKPLDPETFSEAIGELLR